MDMHVPAHTYVRTPADVGPAVNVTARGRWGARPLLRVTMQRGVAVGAKGRGRKRLPTNCFVLSGWVSSRTALACAKLWTVPDPSLICVEASVAVLGTNGCCGYSKAFPRSQMGLIPPRGARSADAPCERPDFPAGFLWLWNDRDAPMRAAQRPGALLAQLLAGRAQPRGT